MKNISIIVAIDEKNGIGLGNKLLCHIPEDLKRFKKITSGHTVIMGKNTYDSLPVKPLPNRTNIVLSHIHGEVLEGCKMAYSIDEVLALCNCDDECFIMGGGSVYKQFLPHANKLYLTRIHKTFDADTFFPEINFGEWELIDEVNVENDCTNDFTYSYQIFLRKSAK